MADPITTSRPVTVFERLAQGMVILLACCARGKFVEPSNEPQSEPPQEDTSWDPKSTIILESNDAGGLQPSVVLSELAVSQSGKAIRVEFKGAIFDRCVIHTVLVPTEDPRVKIPLAPASVVFVELGTATVEVPTDKLVEGSYTAHVTVDFMSDDGQETTVESKLELQVEAVELKAIARESSLECKIAMDGFSFNEWDIEIHDGHARMLREWIERFLRPGVRITRADIRGFSDRKSKGGEAARRMISLRRACSASDFVCSALVPGWNDGFGCAEQEYESEDLLKQCEMCPWDSLNCEGMGYMQGELGSPLKGKARALYDRRVEVTFSYMVAYGDDPCPSYKNYLPLP